MSKLFWLTVMSIGTTGYCVAPAGKYKVIFDQMNALMQSYPTYASVFSIGQNDEGTELYAMRISTTPHAVDPQKIGHLIVSTHHGNERAAPVFTMQYTRQLLERFASDLLWKTNLASFEWTILPVLNVSGYNTNDRYEHGYDPNRDYAGPCHSDPGGKLKSIRNLVELISKRTYSGAVTVHGYLGSLTYPWGVDVANTHTRDHNYFDAITSKAATINHYKYGTSTDIVYPVNGAFEDFVYWKYGLWSLLLELRNGSEVDIGQTVTAIMTYFNELDASPSLDHSLTSNCLRSRPDLHLE